MAVPKYTALRTRSQAVSLFKILNHQSLLENRLTFSQLSRYLTYRFHIELLFHQPYTREQFWVDAGIAKRQAAADYPKKIEEIGILSVHKVGKENLYLNTKLYEILSK